MSSKHDVRMTREEIVDLLGGAGTAFVAWRTPEGSLRARPMRYRTGPDTLVLAGEAVPEGAPACAVVDTYPTYDAIRGALLGGTIRQVGGAHELAIERAAGFDFTKAHNR